MPFNISDFKSTFDRFGGPARTNLFEVRINRLPRGVSALVSPRDFRFFCSQISVPGINFEQATQIHVGQRQKVYPMGITTEPVSGLFLCDSSHQIISFFHQWAQQIINYGTAGGNFSEVDGKLPYEVGYKDEYSTDITIHHYTTDSFESRYYETKLEKAFPIAVGDVQLAWSENDSFLQMPISFSYDRISYSGEKVGGRGRLNRGDGLLGLIGAVAGFTDVVRQTINQGNSPTSIQDAVNRLNRVRNSFDNISDRI